MSANLDNLPLDMLQETAVTLGRYVQARRREKLLEERDYLRRELRTTQESRAELEALQSPMSVFTSALASNTGVRK